MCLVQCILLYKLRIQAWFGQKTEELQMFTLCYVYVIEYSYMKVMYLWCYLHKPAWRHIAGVEVCDIGVVSLMLRVSSIELLCLWAVIFPCPSSHEMPCSSADDAAGRYCCTGWCHGGMEGIVHPPGELYNNKSTLSFKGMTKMSRSWAIKNVGAFNVMNHSFITYHNEVLERKREMRERERERERRGEEEGEEDRERLHPLEGWGL